MARSSFGVASSRPQLGDEDATPAMGPRITTPRPTVRGERAPSKRTRRSRAYKRKQIAAGKHVPAAAPRAPRKAAAKPVKTEAPKPAVRAPKAVVVASQHQPVYDPRTSIAHLSTAWEGGA